MYVSVCLCLETTFFVDKNNNDDNFLRFER